MIKTTLKHYIYDYCINLIFNGIYSNFIGVDMGQFKIGDKCSIIELLLKGGFIMVYYDCAVISFSSPEQIKFMYNKVNMYNDKRCIINRFPDVGKGICECSKDLILIYNKIQCLKFF